MFASMHLHNPPQFHFDINMNRQKISLWIGLCGNGTIMEGNLNGEQYLHMINEEIVPQLQEHFQQQQRGAFRRLWWVQDGAPAHQRIILRDRHQELFNHRVIALNCDPEWPPRASDLTPCDFFSLGVPEEQGLQNTT